MQVVQINFPLAPAALAPAQVLERWPTLADVAEAAAGAGLRVSVIQAAAYAERIQRHGVDYRFINLGQKSAAVRARAIAASIEELGADIAHVHGLEFAREAQAFSRSLPRLPILFQDHANAPPSRWRRPWWRRWYACASAVAFTSLEQARPFRDARLFPRPTRVFAIPESSSRFVPGDRAQARAETGLHGDPCVLWVGHLNAHKGIATVLDGVARAALELPDLQLWCAFATAPLLAAVQQRIADDARLRGRVHLVGKVAHAQIEHLMRAADVFVSGSRGESTGYALLEALACGTAPVVTDIPAFRALTDAGRIGRLWPCGDAGRLAAALVQVAAQRPSTQQVRAHFDATLSPAALGRRWADAYQATVVCRENR